MTAKLLIWGAGSQALIASDYFRLSYGYENLVIFDPINVNCKAKIFTDKSVVYTNSIIELVSLWSSLSHFLVCIGGEFGYARAMTSRALEKLGLHPQSMIQCNVDIHPMAQIGRGVQIMSGVIIQTRVSIGDYCIINTGATIDHETVVGEGVHIMGGATVTGRVHVGSYSTIGTKAAVLPDLDLGKFCFVGAGATVLSDIPEGTVFVGSPAKFSRYQSEKIWFCERLDELKRALQQ